MSGGSQQLRQFRRALHLDGKSIEEAAAIAGIEIAEARLHAADDAKNPPGPECFELIPVRLVSATPSDFPSSDGAAPDTGFTLRHGENTMRPKTKHDAETGEILDDVDAPEIEMPDDESDQDHLIDLAEGTLRGDVRDSLLGWIKTLQKPWGAMSESEKRNLADAANRYARTLVRTACKLIAANERPVIVATLAEYKEKDGVEAKLKLAGTAQNIVELHNACGKEVLIVTSGSEQFDQEGGPAEIEPDAPEFPGLDAEGLDQAA